MLGIGVLCYHIDFNSLKKLLTFKCIIHIYGMANMMHKHIKKITLLFSCFYVWSTKDFELFSFFLMCVADMYHVQPLFAV